LKIFCNKICSRFCILILILFSLYSCNQPIWCHNGKGWHSYWSTSTLSLSLSLWRVLYSNSMYILKKLCYKSFCRPLLAGFTFIQEEFENLCYM